MTRNADALLISGQIVLYYTVRHSTVAVGVRILIRTSVCDEGSCQLDEKAVIKAT